ncbi:MAG: glycoside hydrolase family 127 protein [Clostridia bacterium]|nr:glycoside hydrolase family 127 protein [Clostridia bacterium]
MSLKPIYGKAPMTDLKALALRCGRLSLQDENAGKLYALLSARLDCVPFWAPAFRLAAMLKNDPMQEMCARVILDAVAAQQANGAYDEALRADVDKASAVWAMYEMTADKALVESLMRWCAHLDAVWADVMGNTDIRVCAADLLDVLCNLYRVTGKKAVLKLCERIRQEGMNWTGVLHTFSVQRPMKRIMPVEELLDSMSQEDGTENGFYTRQYMTCRADLLADGARSSALLSTISGNGQEYAAAATGWKKIARYHGAACGGTTGDPTLEGNAPSAAVSTASVGAWLEAFAAQLETNDDAWAGDEMEKLMVNAASAALCDGGVLRFQRVNSLGADAGDWGCYYAAAESVGEVASMARLARGYADALQSAVMTTPAGIRVNMLVPGSYTVRLGGEAAKVTVEGNQVKVSLKKDTEAAMTIRVPGWVDDSAYIRVNEDGADSVKPGTFFAITRVWHDGDTVTVSFPETVRVEKGYHQSLCIYQGSKLMAMPVTRADWAYAAAGEPEKVDGQVMLTVVPVNDWRAAGLIPFDMPICPEHSGEKKTVALKPYGETAVRLAQFPRSVD